MRKFPELTGLWRNRDFVRLWVGITLSQLGSGLGALGLVAVVMLEASPLQMGILSGAGVAPGVMFGLGIGVWADRMRLRPILVITSIVRALSLTSVPAAFALDVLLMEQLYGVALINGVCRTFTSVSFGAYLPKVVGRGNLVEANSKLAASGSVVETSAFSVGGWIAQLASAVATVITEALSFVLSALFFLAIRIPESEVSSNDKHRSTLREVWEGLAFVFANPVLRTLAGSAVAEGLLHGGVGAVILIYGVRELGLDTGVLATIFAVGGISSLMGATYSTRVARLFGVGPATVVGLLLFGIGTLLLALARGPIVIAGAVLVIWQLFDAAYTIYGINEVSLRQAVTPDGMLGRVTATFQFVGIAVFLVGLLLGGALAEIVGLRPTLVVAGVCGVVGAVWLFLSPVWKLREIPHDEDSRKIDDIN